MNTWVGGVFCVTKAINGRASAVYVSTNHPKMHVSAALSTGVLFINAAWDLLSAAAICLFVAYRRCGAVAYAHLGLWVEDEDRMDERAAAVMAVLLLQWGLTRLHGALAGPVSEAACVDALVTYMLEGMLVVIEVVAGNMHPGRGWFVVAACGVCWAVVIFGCFELY